MGVLLSAHWYNFVTQHEYTAEKVQTDPTIHNKPQQNRKQRTRPRGSAEANSDIYNDCDSAVWNNSHTFFLYVRKPYGD